MASNNMTGSLTSVGDVVTLTGRGDQTALMALSGTFSTATVAFRVSPDGSNWYSARGIKLSDGSAVTSASGISAAAAYLVPINGMRCQAQLTAITSGTVAVNITSFPLPLSALLPPDASTISSLTAGASADIGAVSDAAVQSDANGSIIAFLRGLTIATYGKYVTVAVTPTVSTSPAYTSGDNVGGKLTLASVPLVSAGAVKLQSLTIIDHANQGVALEILVFNANPTAATLTDNAATVLSTDQTKVAARIPVATGDYVATDSNKIVTLASLNRVIQAASGTSLYAAITTTGTPTYAATTDLKLVFGFER